MDFRFSIIFNGICAYVPIVKRNNGTFPQDTYQMRVPLIDAGKAGKKALDTTDLTMHKAFMLIPASALGLPAKADVWVIWYLNQESVDVIPDGGDRFDYVWSGRETMEAVPRIAKVVPTPQDGSGDPPGKIDPAFLEPCGQDLQALFTINHGRVCSIPSAQEWKFVQTLVSNKYEGEFTSKVKVDMGEVKGVKLRIKPCDGSAPSELTLKSQGDLTILVSNLPTDDPLGWDEARPPHGNRDLHLKWLYFLCKDRQNIKKELKGHHLPVPERKGKVQPRGANPNRCMGFQFAPEHM